MKDIILIIPNYNQVTYLINLINWWKWYYPDNLIFVVDNGSTNPHLLKFYEDRHGNDSRFFGLEMYEENNCTKNLSDFIYKFSRLHEYYVISDPDIMPLPNTPPNFLEIFKHCIDHYGYDHVGFGLKTDDIPDWFEGRANMLHDEQSLLHSPVKIEYGGKEYTGYRAPIDTTFALYKTKNGGWQNPMPSGKWSNSLRLFQAYHLPWYLSPDHLNEEMKYYFETAKYRIPGKTSTGVNNYRPYKYKPDE